MNFLGNIEGDIYTTTIYYILEIGGLEVPRAIGLVV